MPNAAGVESAHARQHPTLFDALSRNSAATSKTFLLNLFSARWRRHVIALPRFCVTGRVVRPLAAEERFTRFKHATGPERDIPVPHRARVRVLPGKVGASIDKSSTLPLYCDFDVGGMCGTH